MDYSQPKLLTKGKWMPEQVKKIRLMWKTGRFIYFCPKCHKPFLSNLIWLSAYCQICLYGKKINEVPKFHVKSAV